MESASRMTRFLMYLNASIERRKRGPRGTAGAGLGLSIVQAICRAHGGTVSVTSTEGRGTTVQVRLPRTELAAPTVPEDQHAVIR